MQYPDPMIQKMPLRRTSLSQPYLHIVTAIGIDLYAPCLIAIAASLDTSLQNSLHTYAAKRLELKCP